jgi:hypothetical protein
MLFLLQRESKKLGLKFSYKNIDYEKLIIDKFFNGKYFIDQLDSNEISSDGFTFLYFFDLLKDEKKLKSHLNEIYKKNLDYPFPLKYSNLYKRGNHVADFFAPNYEGNVIWVHLGLCYMKMIYKYDKKLAKKYVDSYLKIVLKYKSLLEVFNENKTPYKSWIYISDEAMSWIAGLLNLYLKIYKKKNKAFKSK